MKKFFAFLAAAFTFVAAQAGDLRATGMTMVSPGAFTLGIGIGVPGWNNNNAVMPMLTVNGSWGVASGFINTRNFGQNGGVDLGFQYGFCGYDSPEMERLHGGNYGFVENLILFRAAFHYQFVKKLDTYLGFHGGVAISSPTGDWSDHARDTWGNCNGVFGTYLGGKWYFTDVFGAGVEFEGDWLKGHSTPNVSAVLSFKF